MKTSSKTLMTAFALMIAVSPLTAETFTGRLVDTTGLAPRAGSATFRLQIDDYSSAEEVRGLAAVLSDEGAKALKREMRDLDRGWLRIDGGLPVQVALARSIEHDGGRRVRVVIDRPISFFETWHHLRTRDYPVTVLELQLDETGRGQGTLIGAAQLKMGEDETLEVESFGRRPLRVTNVRQRS